MVTVPVLETTPSGLVTVTVAVLPGAVRPGGLGHREGDLVVAPGAEGEGGRVGRGAPVGAVVAEREVGAVLVRPEVRAGDGDRLACGSGAWRDGGDCRGRYLLRGIRLRLPGDGVGVRRRSRERCLLLLPGGCGRRGDAPARGQRAARGQAACGGGCGRRGLPAGRDVQFERDA